MNHKKQPATRRKITTKKSLRRHSEQIIITPKGYTHINPSIKGLLIVLARILATAFAYWLAAHP